MGIISKVSTSAAIRQASRLVAEGRPYEALGKVAAANRKFDSLDLERAFVDILLQTGPDSESSNPELRPASEALGGLRQAEYGKIPEVQASELNAGVLRAAIETSGHLIARNFFSDEDAGALRNCIDNALNSRVDISEGKASADSPWYYPSPHFPGNHQAYSQRNNNKKFHRTGSFKVIDSPRGAFTVLEMYRKYGVKKLVSEFFGEPPVIAARKWVFRHVTPRPSDTLVGGGWHQDGQFMGEHARALNMWVALSECGEGTPAPGIMIIPKRLEKVVEFGTRGAKLDWVVGGNLVRELSADVGATEPHFQAGDALFFDHLSLHRSGLGAGQTQPRYALESWFYARTGNADNDAICFY